MDFRILGPLEVLDGDRPLALGTPQTRALLAVLVVHAGQVVSVERLADELWPQEQQSTDSRPTIHTYVSRVRRILRSAQDGDADRLVTRRPGYLLRVEPGELDLHRFDELVTAARAAGKAGDLPESVALLRRASALWRGDPLDGLALSPGLAAEAGRLAEYRLDTLEELFQGELALGNAAVLVTELSALVDRYPLRERFCAQLMLALYRTGRQAEALQAFQRARTTLADELGADPGPELQELHTQILRGSPELAAPARDKPPSERPVDRAAQELATAVARQWTAEAETRSLRRPEPVHVRWSSTGRPVSAAAAAVLGGADGPDLHGELADVVTQFRRLPARQLVVLGEAGAGKTVLAMLLTLGLLADPEPGEPVPVLLPLSSWDPRHEHLHQWLARRLVEEYPGLANRSAYGRDAALRLVLEGKVIPVLDGLDETPPGLHSAAIDALDQAMGGRPLVVTCRSTEYEKAIHHGGAILASAAVVELEPVEPADAIRFLTARQRVDDQRWQPVVEHLRQHPEGPLAQALSTPLMVDLARTSYTDPGTDPAELLDPARFPGHTEIEEHLLDAFLPAAYSHRPPPPASEELVTPLRRYEPAQAQRWLTFLAKSLHRGHTRDLAWWQLVRTIPPIARGLLFGLPPALMFALTGTIAAGPLTGLVYGVSFALAGGITQAHGRRPGPLRVEVRLRGTAARFLTRFAIGVVVGIALGLDWTLDFGHDLLLALVFGLALGSQVWLDAPADATRVTSPAVVLRQERGAALSLTVSFALSLGLFYGMAFKFAEKDAILPVLGGRFDLAIALAGGLASALLGRFLFRRLGALVYGLAGAAVIGGQGFPSSSTATQALMVGLTFGLAVGLIVALSRAWGAFGFSRIWLALRGKAPLRLMRFLDDAHRRGVLRQAGAVYQFRHARLQDRLANRDQPAD